MKVILPPLPSRATTALISGSGMQGPEMRLLVDAYEPSSAQYAESQMNAYAVEAVMADRASRAPTATVGVEEMTLRDYFAGHALMGVSSDPGCTAEMCARFAYEIADEMMKARAL